MNEKGYETIKFSDFDAFGHKINVTNVDLFDFDFVQYIQKRLIKNMDEYILENSRKVARTLLNIDTSQMSNDELDQHLDFAALGGSDILVYWDKEYLFRFNADYSYDGYFLTVKFRVAEYRSLKSKWEDK